jgi:hypothetical protein
MAMGVSHVIVNEPMPHSQTGVRIGPEGHIDDSGDHGEEEFQHVEHDGYWFERLSRSRRIGTEARGPPARASRL